MPSFIAKRIILFVPTLVLVTIIVFILFRVASNPYCFDTTDDTVDDCAPYWEDVRNDSHILIQYVDWFINMWRLDFGNSYAPYVYGPIGDRIKATLPFTLELTILAMLISTLVAVPLGMAPAITRGVMMDHAARGIATMWTSLPNFWMAMLLIFLLGKDFNWTPTFFSEYVLLWNEPGTSLRQMALPALALSFAAIVPIGRAARMVMLEALGDEDTLETKGNGHGRQAIKYRHALKKALLPAVIIGGHEFGRLLAGAVVIEVLFNTPGMGKLLWDSAVFWRDFRMIEGIIVVAVVVVMVWNLALDVAYAWVNPRVRYS